MAFGSGTVGAIGGAVSDIFASKGHELTAEGHRLKAKGSRLEAENYLRAADFADKNVRYTRHSTEIKTMQLTRQIAGVLGGIASDVGAAGLAQSGSSVDILRDSAAQGAMSKAILQEQGLITEEGYKEQARSYRLQSEAAGIAAEAAERAAEASDSAAEGALWSAGFKFAGAAVSVLPV